MLAIVAGSCNKSATSDDRLEFYHQQCESLIDCFDYNSLDTMSLQYLNELTGSNDSRHLAYAHFYRGATCLYTGRMEMASAELSLSKDYAAQIDNDSIVALALNSIGIHEATANNNLYLAQWYFVESLKHAQRTGYSKLECTIYGNLCTLAKLQNDTSLMSYVRESYDYGIEHEDQHVVFLAALNLGGMYGLKKEYDSACYYCQRAVDIGKQNGLNKLPIAYAALSEANLDLGNLEEAAKWAQTAIDLAEKEADQMVLVNAYNKKAMVCSHKGVFSESNEWLYKALDMSEFIDMEKSKIYHLMAENYESLGMVEKALEFMRLSNESLESTNASDRERMKRERDVSFNVIDQERQLEFNRRQLQSRNLIIGGLVLLIVLLAFMLWMGIRVLRKRNALYERIVRQQIESVEREKVVESIPDVSEPSEKSHRIYEEVCRLMEEERIYADPQISRESLAQKLGTNKTYLTNIISECSGGMNLSQFVNQYRLREALRLLSDKQYIDYPLKQMSSDLGFGSISTFYKLFQDKVGVTPSAYRKSFIKVSK